MHHYECPKEEAFKTAAASFYGPDVLPDTQQTAPKVKGR